MVGAEHCGRHEEEGHDGRAVYWGERGEHHWSFPVLFRPDEKPRYDRGVRANLALFVVRAGLVALGAVLIKVLNRRQAARRRALGKAERIADLNMADKKAVGEGEEGMEGEDEAVGARAFEDVTDLQNEDFIYVY